MICPAVMLTCWISGAELDGLAGTNRTAGHLPANPPGEADDVEALLSGGAVRPRSPNIPQNSPTNLLPS
jgi:hypothetical protein